MARLRSSLLAFFAGMAVVIAFLVFGDLHQTVIAAVKATLVRDVDHPANYPYIGTVDTISLNPTVPTTTPDGKPVKRAVIEYVAGTCSSTLPATIFEVSMTVTQIVGPGTSINTPYSFVPVQTAIAGGISPQYVFSQPVRLYSDPGTSLAATASVDGGPVGGFANYCTLNFSGYLVTE